MTYQITNCEKSHSVQFRDMDLLDGVLNVCVCKTLMCAQNWFYFRQKGSAKWNVMDGRMKKEYKTKPISRILMFWCEEMQKASFTL